MVIEKEICLGRVLPSGNNICNNYIPLEPAQTRWVVGSAFAPAFSALRLLTYDLSGDPECQGRVARNSLQLFPGLDDGIACGAWAHIHCSPAVDTWFLFIPSNELTSSQDHVCLISVQSRYRPICTRPVSTGAEGTTYCMIDCA